MSDQVSSSPSCLSNVKIVDGDLFTATEQYIIHQCNCVTTKSKHLAADVFRHFPEANIYATRTVPDKPGEIKVRGRVIALLAQYYPGNSRFNNDSYEKREQWFRQCLEKVGKMDSIKSIALPWAIGCGAAGGCWDRYKAIIDEFASSHPAIQVVIYRKQAVNESNTKPLNVVSYDPYEINK